ncbi:hypothetical protein F0562_025800 [Nyssa sinensis]|uniref:TF-B3 domain-containing protein n=1 Tax=Nyssa sinensis TaxID=561372 RepID=A0A5J5B946_9ASTE|nr:hypothetical protein F0562_025800 [Nyssa sinensis]
MGDAETDNSQNRPETTKLADRHSQSAPLPYWLLTITLLFAVRLWFLVRLCTASQTKNYDCDLHNTSNRQIWRMESLCFEKQLTETDVNSYLEIPEATQYLPTGDEVIQVVDENGYVWQFKASLTTTGKRCLTQQWQNFVAVASPRNGDTFKYYRLFSQNVYLVKLQRKPALRLFGVDIYV